MDLLDDFKLTLKIGKNGLSEMPHRLFPVYYDENVVRSDLSLKLLGNTPRDAIDYLYNQITPIDTGDANYALINAFITEIDKQTVGQKHLLNDKKFQLGIENDPWQLSLGRQIVLTDKTKMEWDPVWIVKIVTTEDDIDKIFKKL